MSHQKLVGMQVRVESLVISDTLKQGVITAIEPVTFRSLTKDLYKLTVGNEGVMYVPINSLALGDLQKGINRSVLDRTEMKLYHIEKLSS